MKPVPILFMSDSPHLPTGLSRITRDLALHTARLPQFRVGTLGRGGVSSSRLPFANYCFDERDQWGESWLESVWEDFAGSEQGIVMTIWDLSRLNWFARPRMEGSLKQLLESKRFQKWAYVPVDSYGIGQRLTGLCRDTLEGFDRVLAYTLFGKQVLEDTLGREVDWMPHGYDANKFQPREQGPGRAMLGVGEEEELIGCVMSNQSRKDWGTAFGTWAYMKKPNRKFWAHVDVLERYWNIMALIEDFRFQEGDIKVTLTGSMTSETLSYLYSACNVTMLPSLGEGFGYPIVESLACGVPVVHTNYGGGAEFVPFDDWKVDSAAERLDGLWNCVRPVLSPTYWAHKVNIALEQYGDGSYREACVGSVSHLQWEKLWPSAWSKWMLSGIGKNGVAD